MTDVVASPSRARQAPLSDSGPMGWLRTEIDRLFDDFGRPGRSLFSFAPRDLAPVPALAMTETDIAYRVTAELPGLALADVTVELADGVLTISGEKKEAKEESGGGCLISERRYGVFARQLAVPSDVDPEGIKASFRDGVLTVTLAKDAKVAPRSRKIEVDG